MKRSKRGQAPTGDGPERWVSPHVTYREAWVNQQQRGESFLFDLHGLYWCVPGELTICRVAEQVADVMKRLNMRTFPEIDPPRVISRPPREQHDLSEGPAHLCLVVP